MRRRLTTALLALATGAALAAGIMPTPAAAADVPGTAADVPVAPAVSLPQLRPNQLILTIDGATGPRAVLLDCTRRLSDHPLVDQACDELTAAGGDINKIPSDPNAMCIMIYAPVVAQAFGLWNGVPVAYQRTFGNSCSMRVRAGAVFDF